MVSEDAGRRGPRWRRLVANLRMQRRPCWLCGQPIRYDLAWPDPESFTVDHIKPWSTHPHLREDPANLAACHLACNQHRGAGDADRFQVDNTSENW